ISTSAFLDLLRTYLSSLHVRYEGSVYTQKEGICIGSCIAPALCDLYLARGNRELVPFFQEIGVTRCFRYVDDFLVCFPMNKMTEPVCEKVKQEFQKVHSGLEFTFEQPERRRLQFLDIEMAFGDEHTCWMYKTRGAKGILPYDSGHTKLVKRSVASGCVWQAMKKSCHHRISEGLQRQISRLQASGYPEPLLVAVAEKCIATLRGNNKPKEKDPVKKPMVVMPYIHKFSHRLKKIAETHEIKVVLSAPFKLKGLCKKVNKEEGDTSGQSKCGVKHKNQFVECVEGVVYKIPLTCGNSYIGQTGRCLNDRLREHQYACGQLQAPGNLAAHCARCSCKPLFGKTSVMDKSKNRNKREIIEAFHMASGKHGTCVSAPSIALNEKEIELLRHHIA
ncbi:unnamed protein product, partial [Ixodes pacificus]